MPSVQLVRQNLEPSFGISLNLPATVAAGDRLPMLLGLSPNSEKLSCPVHLKEVIGELICHTRVRVPSSFLLGKEAKQSWVNRYNLDDGDALDEPLANITSGTEPLDVMFLPEFTLPTFKTYNVARCYALHVTLVIECAQLKYLFSAERDLFVLPSVVRPRPAPRMPPQHVQEAQRPSEAAEAGENDPPPPYEEVEACGHSRAIRDAVPSSHQRGTNFAGVSTDSGTSFGAIGGLGAGS